MSSISDGMHVSIRVQYQYLSSKNSSCKVIELVLNQKRCLNRHVFSKAACNSYL
jgi:hypothetical protein